MKTAVITGATSGIGNCLLKLFLDDDYIVYAGYRDVKQKKLLTMLSDNVRPFRIDLSKKWTIDEAIKTINSEVEHIDILVNAAGKVVAGPLETLSVSKIREQFEVNTFAQLEFSQGLFEKLDGGKILNLSSVSGYGLFPFLAPYGASKRAMDILFNSLRIETGSKVKIISLKLGSVATPIWKKAVEENEENLNSGKYKVVGDFLKSNAQRNATEALEPMAVARKILKIANSKNPKNSYNIGIDSVCGALVSKLPSALVDRLVEKRLIKLVKAQINSVFSAIEVTEPVETSVDLDVIQEVSDEVYVKDEIALEQSENIENEVIEDSAAEEISEEEISPLELALEEAIQANSSKKNN